VDRPRFDFYKILPGTEEPATDKELKDAARRPAAEQSRRRSSCRRVRFKCPRGR